jgi:formylglycine-generating enzyme required for sulfatase activity
VWFEDETPQHPVPVAAFRLDRDLVTNAAFAAFVAATGHITLAEKRDFGLVYAANYWEERVGACWRRPAGPADSITDRMHHPVVHVTHADATAYAVWAGRRLPTEAEWEYAAHGPIWQCWPWGDDWDPGRANSAEHWAQGRVADFAAWRAWWAAEQQQRHGIPATTPAGAFSPGGDSPFGLTDMAGNVAEWTASRYHMYSSTRVYEPVYTAAARSYMVVRGGGWMNFSYQLRTSERIACDPAYANFATGFRCAADASDQQR